MRRNILLGGIVGIAIGAILTFAIAHGVFAFASQSSAAEAPRQATPSRVEPLEIPDDEVSSRSRRSTARPLRPGSQPLGPHRASLRS